MTSAETSHAGFHGCPGILFAKASNFGDKVAEPYVFAMEGGRGLIRLDGQIVPMTEIATIQLEPLPRVGAMVGGAFSDDVTHTQTVNVLAHITKVISPPETDATIYYSGTLTIGSGPNKQDIKVRGVYGC